MDQVGHFVSALRDEVLAEGIFSREGLVGLIRLTRPIAPFNQPQLFAPLVGLAGALLSLVLAGLAVSSVGTLLAAVLGLVLILTRVFGFSLEIVPLG
jgi:hypothetical protein